VIVGTAHTDGVVTVTPAEHVAVPPAPETVAMKVVSEVGLTALELSTTTLPSPWFIDALVAFEDARVRFDDPPLVIEEGDAVRVQVGADGVTTAGAATVRAAEHVADPPVPETVAV
jgi:hypothetical protein